MTVVQHKTVKYKDGNVETDYNGGINDKDKGDMPMINTVNKL